jgi:hypothetical protein
MSASLLTHVVPKRKHNSKSKSIGIVVITDIDY